MSKKKTIKPRKGDSPAIQFAKKYDSYNSLVAAINRGEISEKDIRKVYSSFRKRINEQVKRTQASDIPFLPGTSPYMSKAEYLITGRDLVHEVAKGLRYYHSKSYSRAQRVAQRATAIEKLAEHGIVITVDQWDDWRRFSQWFESSSFSAIYDSDSAASQEVFKTDPTATGEDWKKAFLRWMKKNNKQKYKEYIALHPEDVIND